jgi:hypothetical protein
MIQRLRHWLRDDRAVLAQQPDGFGQALHYRKVQRRARLRVPPVDLIEQRNVCRRRQGDTKITTCKRVTSTTVQHATIRLRPLGYCGLRMRGTRPALCAAVQ